MILLTIAVVLISLLASILNELISYIFLYRQERYKNLIARMNDAARMIHMMESGEKCFNLKHEKMIRDTFDKANDGLKGIRFKSTVISGITFTSLIAFFNRIFAGRVVGMLPFHPISFIRRISHRNLDGTNYYECSFIFLYIICSSSFKPMLSKFLNVSESRLALKVSQDRSKIF
ncbi:Transmembrane and coiled-coil domains protein 1 [Thelohanellus kitauei]|uniref:Transmembrane and coiled-coil domains protein 1 n=1 Tax=Thelohanellus kitauei TaxID=669202 RepID=A0A0C2M769_THEKT|nr:Transmembrane and coiled-coil domains protein 1 [Thelohanellus kitauei]